MRTLTFVAEDTLPPLKERRRQQAQLGLPVRLKPSSYGSERDDLSFRTEGSVRLLFSAELRPIHLSQSLTFVAQDILPPFERETRRQQAQVVSRQTKSLFDLGSKNPGTVFDGFRKPGRDSTWELFSFQAGLPNLSPLH